MVGHFAGSAPSVEVQPHGDAAEGVERILRRAASLDGARVVTGHGVEVGAGDGHGALVSTAMAASASASVMPSTGWTQRPASHGAT